MKWKSAKRTRHQFKITYFKNQFVWPLSKKRSVHASNCAASLERDANGLFEMVPEGTSSFELELIYSFLFLERESSVIFGVWRTNQRAPSTLSTVLVYTKQTIASIWRENMLGYLSADIICSEWRTVFRERSSRKTVSYEEQIMSNLLRNARSFENWGISSDIPRF